MRVVSILVMNCMSENLNPSTVEIMGNMDTKESRVKAVMNSNPVAVAVVVVGEKCRKAVGSER